MMRSRGFTMIELIVVIIVLGIMALAIVPRFSLLSGFNEAGYNDQIRSAIEFARKAAVASRRHVKVTVAANGLVLTAAAADPDSGFPGSFPRNLNLPGTSSNAITPPANGTLVASVSPLIFDPNGIPLNNAGATLSTASTYTVSGYTVTVEAYTGYVH